MKSVLGDDVDSPHTKNLSVNASSAYDPDNPFSSGFRFTFIVLQVIIMLVGCSGTVAVLVVFSSDRILWKPSYFLVGFLAFVDFLHLTVVGSLKIASVVKGKWESEVECWMAGMMTLTLWTTSVLVTVFIAVNRYIRVCYSNAVYFRVFSPPLVAVFCLAISSFVWLFTIEASAVFYPGLPGCFLHVKISPVHVVTLVTLYCLGYVLVAVLYCRMTSKVRRLADKARPKVCGSRQSSVGNSLQVIPVQESLASARLSAAGFSEERELRDIPLRERRALHYPDTCPIRGKATSHNDFSSSTQLCSSGETLKSQASRRNSNEGSTSSREERLFSPPCRKLSGEDGGTPLKKISEERRKISWEDMQPPAEEKVTVHRKISGEDKSCVRVGDEETGPSLLGYAQTSSVDRLSPLYVIHEERGTITAKSEGDFRLKFPQPEVSGSSSSAGESSQAAQLASRTPSSTRSSQRDKREVLAVEDSALDRAPDSRRQLKHMSKVSPYGRKPSIIIDGVGQRAGRPSSALRLTTSLLSSVLRLSTADSHARTPKEYDQRIDNMTFGFVACTVNMTTCVPFIFCFVFNHLLGFGMPRQVECLSHLVLMCGSALNCVVYGAMNVSFRQSARKLLHRMPLTTAPSHTSPCINPGGTSHAVGGDELSTAIGWHVPTAPISWHRTAARSEFGSFLLVPKDSSGQL